VANKLKLVLKVEINLYGGAYFFNPYKELLKDYFDIRLILSKYIDLIS